MAVILRLIQQYHASHKKEFQALEKQFAELEHRGILPMQHQRIEGKERALQRFLPVFTCRRSVRNLFFAETSHGFPSPCTRRAPQFRADNIGSKVGSNKKAVFSPKRGLSCARSTKVLMAHNPKVGGSNPHAPPASY